MRGGERWTLGDGIEPRLTLVVSRSGVIFVCVRALVSQVAFVNFELPPEDMGTAMKPQQMVNLLEEHIVGQVSIWLLLYFH